MGLHRFKPIPSGRMGLLWVLSTIKDAAIVEYGCMGHMLYSGVSLQRAGINCTHHYSTHIDETDIALGRSFRIEKTIEDILSKNSYKVIFLLPSAVPEVIGVDMRGICNELSLRYDVSLISFDCGSFSKNSYDGVEEGLYQLVTNLVKPLPRNKELCYNIIGACSDYFRFKEDTNELKRLLKSGFGIGENCILTANTTIRQIEEITRAHINIVIRAEGLKAAKYLKDKYGMPYVYGRPYGVKGTLLWLEDISQVLNMAIHMPFVKEEETLIKQVIEPALPQLHHKIRSHPKEVELTIGGPYDVVNGIKNFATNEFHIPIKAIWCDRPQQDTEDIPYYCEEEWIKAIDEASGIIMASGEVLQWKKLNQDCQICNPDTKWRLHSSYPPLVGHRGALNIISMWINSIAGK